MGVTCTFKLFFLLLWTKTKKTTFYLQFGSRSVVVDSHFSTLKDVYWNFDLRKRLRIVSDDLVLYERYVWRFERTIRIDLNSVHIYMIASDNHYYIRCDV